MKNYKQRVSEKRALKKYMDILLGGRSGRQIEKEVRTEDVHNLYSSININAFDCLNHERFFLADAFHRS